MILSLIPLLAQAATAEQTPNIEFGWMFAKTIGAMVVILVLAFLFIKYVMPKMSGVRGISGSRIKILDRVGLEARKGLYVVKVGKKTALVGTSDHTIEKIMDLDPADFKEDE